ncbi:MAG: endolytic transglycosylase MltG, partial [Oscillospiraceae bacterium]|nr:endolytic transglycosylase MltG [Oscillospiraceae bacterium]
YDAAMKLQENNICDASRFLYYFNAGGFGYEFENHLPATTSRLKFYTMEGYFFPDTYTFYEEMEPDAVCRKIYMNFDLKITDEDYTRIEELNTTLDEVIILASMVQAEAANDQEMPEIASVFWNRLHYPENFGGGKLQSDPTSKYVSQVIKPNIELENPQIYDAYDTYICVGLPAGAIGNPGRAAIEAVLYPSETNYFYFYANIDTGVTYFAKTLEEHNANIEMVRQQQAEADAAAAENPENAGDAQ